MSVSVSTMRSDLGLRGRLTEVSWELPEGMDEGEWREAGGLLGRVERSVSWWLGDWWAYGESRYGERKAVVVSEDWSGPTFQTCMDAASVSRAFATSRRHEALSFKHHREVAARPDADELLDWAEETIAVTGKPRSTRELRAEVSRRRVTVGAQPSGETCTVKDLFALAAAGKKFGTIYADPPWLYDNQATRASTGNHYSGMTVDELCELPVGQLAARDAHLHLWTTNAFLEDPASHAMRGSNPGWLQKLRADLLFYYFLDLDKLYVLNTLSLKRWAFGHGDRLGRLYGYPEKPQGKYSQPNDTWGRCVPVAALATQMSTPPKIIHLKQFDMFEEQSF